MQVLRFKDYEELSDYTANVIAESIKNKPDVVVCMASGSTPSLTCDLLVKKLKENNVDYSKFSFIGLDEWAGLPPTNTGSCHYFFHTKIFEPLNLNPSQYYLFNAQAPDLKNECRKMDEHIASKGGIDLMIVGIGMNGHIGFNEPGTSFSSLSHVAELEEITKTVGQKKYFTEQVELSKGITIGLGHLMNTKKVLLIANGAKKIEVIRETVEEPVTESFPASIMQQHKDGYVLVDEDAASLLN
jgi:glucosamine-6-phosphate isomerase